MNFSRWCFFSTMDYKEDMETQTEEGTHKDAQVETNNTHISTSGTQTSTTVTSEFDPNSFVKHEGVIFAFQRAISEMKRGNEVLKNMRLQRVAGRRLAVSIYYFACNLKNICQLDTSKELTMADLKNGLRRLFSFRHYEAMHCDAECVMLKNSEWWDVILKLKVALESSAGLYEERALFYLALLLVDLTKFILLKLENISSDVSENPIKNIIDQEFNILKSTIGSSNREVLPYPILTRSVVQRANATKTA